MTTFISNRTDQFSYFDRQLGHPDWTGKKVLDFGGNVGNILLSEDCRIERDRYWSIDISKDAIELGQTRHPDAHFVFYDRYNIEFNPGGTQDLPIPDLGHRFDFILAWSVFTHTSKAEMVELVDQLQGFLAEGGTLAFTFLDPSFDPPAGWAREREVPGLDNLRWRLDARRRLNPAVDVEALAREALAREAGGSFTWVTLVNDDELHLGPDDDGIEEGKETKAYITLCTEAYMRSVYPRAEVLPPVRPDRQSCCVIRPGVARGT